MKKKNANQRTNEIINITSHFFYTFLFSVLSFCLWSFYYCGLRLKFHLTVVLRPNSKKFLCFYCATENVYKLTPQQNKIAHIFKTAWSFVYLLLLFALTPENSRHLNWHSKINFHFVFRENNIFLSRKTAERKT